MPDLGDFIKQTIGRVPENLTLQRMGEIAADNLQAKGAAQQASQMDLMATLQERTNPFGFRLQQRSKELKTRFHNIKKMMETREKGRRLIPIAMIKQTAERYQHKNRELRAKSLLKLRDLIEPDDGLEEILQKVRDYYPDVSLADEVLEFLLETTEGELHNTILKAKEEFGARFGREIRAGRNIAEAAREASDKGLGKETPTTLRGMYRDITGNRRESSIVLFKELTDRYNYQELKKVITFFYHALGDDFKAHGPSIPREQLQVLMEETRSLQAIMGVLTWFKKRHAYLEKRFIKHSVTLPPEVNFEHLSKRFIELASNRYCTKDTVLFMADKLGIQDSLPGKIIVFDQFRDAVHQVAVKQIYGSPEHRLEVTAAIIGALETLEEELEALEEQMEKELKDQEKGKTAP